jgi:hypothetical protein
MYKKIAHGFLPGLPDKPKYTRAEIEAAGYTVKGLQELGFIAEISKPKPSENKASGKPAKAENK